MLTKVNFEERVKLIPLDMNDLHDETENGLGELVQSVTGTPGTVLFKNAFNVAVVGGGNILMTIPEQWFGINGVPGKIPLQTLTIGPAAGPAMDYKLYFVLRRNDVLGTRDRYQIVGGVIQIVSDPNLIIRKTLTARVEITSAIPPAVPPPPTLTPDDLGYVEFAAVSWNGAMVSSTHNTPAIWTFPGYASGVGLHAGSHLSTGLDPIQLASLGGPLGSIEGLMPAGSYAVLMQAVQYINVDVACPYLTATLVGDNSFGSPKHVDLRLRHDPVAFKVLDVSGTKYLAMNFPSGPFAGNSGQPAASNHRHAPDEMPVVVGSAKVVVGTADLGDVVSVPDFDTTGVFSVQVFWAPPGVTMPMFECGWFQGSSGRIGVKPIVTASGTVKLECGGYSFIELTPGALALAVAAVGGTSNWDRAAAGEAYPTSGWLYVRIIGSR